MNFSIAKEDFSRLLYLTNSIVEKRNTMPILANVKITAENDSVSLSATDLEVSLIGDAKAKVKTPGSITVDARMLHDIVKELPQASINVTLSKGNRVEIDCEQSRFKINGFGADEFPAIVGTTLKNPVKVDSEKICQMLEKTAYAVSTDETRYNINGVLLQSLDGLGPNKQILRLVATDGHRLALIDRPAEGLTLDESVIIPRKGIQEIKKVLEGNEGVAEVGLDEGFLTIKSGNVTLGVRLVDGQFPDYHQVIPQNHSTTLEVGRTELFSAVKRVSLVTTDKNKAIKLKVVGDNLVVSSSSPEFGEALESLTVKKDGEDVTVGFSARYISDLLSTMSESDSITVKFSGEVGPGMISGSNDEDYFCVVMPMRFE